MNAGGVVQAMSLTLAATIAACADPVVDRKVDALGPEMQGVPPGPLHRPGQPCLLCHDARGDARVFSVAGTVFVAPGGGAPSVGTVVELFDADGTTFRTATNCAGNFFVEPGAFTPRYPLYVALEHDGARIEMDSPIFRDGSCASCHGAVADPASAGPVYRDALGATTDAPEGCP